MRGRFKRVTLYLIRGYISPREKVLESKRLGLEHSYFEMNFSFYVPYPENLTISSFCRILYIDRKFYP